RRTAGGRRGELGLELTWSTAATTARARAGATAATTRAAPLAAQLVTTVFAPRAAPAIAVELPGRLRVVRFEIAIDAFAAGACGSSTRRGLDHDQRGLVLLWHLGWRQPGLLQRGKLAEQRFLQRSSHTRSLLSVKVRTPLLLYPQ